MQFVGRTLGFSLRRKKDFCATIEGHITFLLSLNNQDQNMFISFCLSSYYSEKEDKIKCKTNYVIVIVL